MNWNWKGQTIYPYEGFYRRASERFAKGSIGGGYDTMLVAVMEIEYEDIQDVSIPERSE
jgi:hypothetical protein